MKNRLFLLRKRMNAFFRVNGLLLLMVFAACHSPHREARRMVAYAEALADTLPDSTVLLIDSVLRMEVCFSEKSRMDMALLQAEALFRDVSMDDDDINEILKLRTTSPDLERASRYYAGKKEHAKAAHAALYSGYVQRYYREKEHAMESFKDAEQYGTLAGEGLIVARAQYRMGEMFLDEGRGQESLDLLKKTDQGFDDDQYYEKALIQNMMGVSYMLLAQFDSAELCLQQGLQYAEMAGSSGVKHKVLNNYSVLCRQKKEFGLAIQSLRQLLADHDLDTSERFMGYLNTGKIFMAMGSMDSAACYFHQMKELLPLVDLKNETLVVAYSALTRMAKTSGDYLSALQYLEKHEELLYDVMNQRQDQTLLRIKHQYDFENLQNTMNIKTARIQQSVAVVLVILLGVIVFFLYRSFQRSRREAEMNANLFHFMQQNEQLRHSHEAIKNEDIARSQHMSELLLQKFQAMQKLDCYLNNPGEKKLLNELEKDLFKDKSHLAAIMEVMDEMYPGLRETVMAKYPQMSELEYEVYLLSRFKLSRMEEASLLGMSTSVLDKVRGKVRRMMLEAEK